MGFSIFVLFSLFFSPLKEPFIEKKGLFYKPFVKNVLKKDSKDNTNPTVATNFFYKNMQTGTKPFYKNTQTSLSGTKPLVFKDLSLNDTHSKLEQLKQITKQSTALEIHNKALEFLKNNQKTEALLLLKYNAYRGFFPPSIKLLFKVKHPPSLLTLLWQGAVLCSALAFLFFLILSFKSFSRFKWLLASFFLFVAVFFGGAISVKSRVEVLHKTKLLSNPFVEATNVKGYVQPSRELIVLKDITFWLKVKDLKTKDTGWLPKSHVFQTFFRYY